MNKVHSHRQESWRERRSALAGCLTTTSAIKSLLHPHASILPSLPPLFLPSVSFLHFHDCSVRTRHLNADRLRNLVTVHQGQKQGAKHQFCEPQAISFLSSIYLLCIHPFFDFFSMFTSFLSCMLRSFFLLCSSFFHSCFFLSFCADFFLVLFLSIHSCRLFFLPSFFLCLS